MDPNYQPTTSAELRRKHLDINDKLVIMDIWDTAGAEKYRCINRHYYIMTNVVQLVFDQTDESSFEDIKEYHKDLDDYESAANFVIVVGNKCDLFSKRKVSKDSAKKWANSKHMKYMECSAASGQGVKAQFEKISVRFQMDHCLKPKFI